MNARTPSLRLATLLGFLVCACGSSNGDGPAGSGGDAGNSGAGNTVTGGADSAGAASSVAGTGGSSAGGTSPGAGGSPAGKGGSGAGTGAASGAGAAGGATGACAIGAWPEADPAVTGPFQTVTETNVGPAAGVGEDAAPVAFTLFRPKDLAQSGLCHPVVTWGNGTGSNPSLYKTLLNHLASHGFVVIASDSPNVGQGNPPPMVAGVAWVLEQNADPASPLYQRIDTAHIGATGHSQGGFATATAAGDSRVTTMAPLCGARSPRDLHGPALLFCGGKDTAVSCSTIQRSFDGIVTQPVMLANYLEADHANWITFRGTTPSKVETVVTAWMRVQLMGDTALRPWFYGASCKLCTDPEWQITQRMMDE